MEPRALLSSADRDARALLDAALLDWSRPVPRCPGWDAASLVGHVGGVLDWMAAIVTSGTSVSRRHLYSAPAETTDLPSWYLAALERAVDVLGSADPDHEVWTFSPTGDHRARWWCRRLAVEVAIHRWDMEQAVTVTGGSSPRPVNGEVAVAGIEEFVIEFLPGLLAADQVEGVTGVLHLDASDGPTSWWIDLDVGGLAVAEGSKADVTVGGTRSDLLLWMTNRVPLTTLEVSGNDDTVRRWEQLRR